ncbi:MAG: type II toxin-antitoxin system PemK/MazF family toxin [Alphaproteobacteria bacterium]|nr:type II toxin-antitoxin system PemK/MazF family toxin [Alphaproteobacteria bacterium]
MSKDFESWHNLKIKIDTRINPPSFQQQQIWWCNVGTNIGHEEDGKAPQFVRPVLIVRKFNAHIFLGVPLTTQVKTNPYYHKIIFKEKEQCAMLSQIRVWDSKRMINEMGKLSDSQFKELINAIKNML